LRVERRRFTRVVAEAKGLQVLSRELKITGKLKDISEGGLSYHYTPIDGGEAPSEEIDILGKGPDRFFLPGLVCNRIYDITELAADRTFTGAKIRLRGLEFPGVTEEQKQKLELLLEKLFFKTANNDRA